MEAITELLKMLNSLSPLAIVALLGLVLLLQAKNQKTTMANQTAVMEVKDNHLHELPKMAEDLKTLVDTLQRIEVNQGENFAYLKARLNGGAK